MRSIKVGLTTKDSIDKNDYLNVISNITNRIKSNDFKKIVFSRSRHVEFDKEFNLIESMKILRNLYPECINFFIKLSDRGIFFGSTPERLIEKNNANIETEAIAGTIRRGQNTEDDKKLGLELMNDKKNLQEHQLVIEQIRKLLSPQLIDIKISKTPYILKLKNVLKSKLKGNLKRTFKRNTKRTI